MTDNTQPPDEIPDVAIPSGTHFTSCGYQDGRACTCARTDARIKAERQPRSLDGVFPSAPETKVVPTWLGHILGIVLVACLCVVMIAATVAAVRALLW